MAVGSLQSIPMLVSPVAVIADTDVAHETFLARRLLGGYGESKRPIGVNHHTTIAVGLLHIVVTRFDYGMRR